MSAKHRITVNLEDPEYELLQQMAKDTDRSLAWLGRKAICAFIKQHQRAKTPLLTGHAKANSHIK